MVRFRDPYSNIIGVQEGQIKKKLANNKYQVEFGGNACKRLTLNPCKLAPRYKSGDVVTTVGLLSDQYFNRKRAVLVKMNAYDAELGQFNQVWKVKSCIRYKNGRRYEPVFTTLTEKHFRPKKFKCAEKVTMLDDVNPSISEFNYYGRKWSKALENRAVLHAKQVALKKKHDQLVVEQRACFDSNCKKSEAEKKRIDNDFQRALYAWADAEAAYKGNEKDIKTWQERQRTQKLAVINISKKYNKWAAEEGIPVSHWAKVPKN